LCCWTWKNFAILEEHSRCSIFQGSHLKKQFKSHERKIFSDLQSNKKKNSIYDSFALFSSIWLFSQVTCDASDYKDHENSFHMIQNLHALSDLKSLLVEFFSIPLAIFHKWDNKYLAFGALRVKSLFVNFANEKFVLRILGDQLINMERKSKDYKSNKILTRAAGTNQ